jgi:single-strand DNA-binding protein
MMNEAQITLAGYVATQPSWRETNTGRPNLTMRVAWTPRRMDRTTGEWTDGNTSYVTVICWRKLADNVATCLRKGDPVLVQGRLSVRSYEDKQGMPRIAVDVDAHTVGHDLNRGVATFQRTRPPTGKTAAEHAADAQVGSDGENGQAEAVAAGMAEHANGSADRAGAEMFDEDAIGALAEDPDGAEGAEVPF